MLNFPNPSRSFDATKNRVQFWGYDSAIEVSFYVEADALQKLCPQMGNAEAEFLKSFDGARQQIYDVANKVYKRGDNDAYTYILAAGDF